MVQSERQNNLLRNSQAVLTERHYLLIQGKGLSAIHQEHVKTKATNKKDKGLTVKDHGREFRNTSGNTIFSSSSSMLQGQRELYRGWMAEGSFDLPPSDIKEAIYYP